MATKGIPYLKKCNNPGGNWNPGLGVDPIIYDLIARYIFSQHMVNWWFGLVVWIFAILL